MAVHHILKNGKQVKDIGGHVVKMADCRGLYLLLDTFKQQPPEGGTKREGRAS